MKKNCTIPCFSYGTEAAAWMCKNCDNCIKGSRYNPKTDTYTNAGVPYKMIYTFNIWAVDVMPSDKGLMMRLVVTFARILFHLEHQDRRETK